MTLANPIPPVPPVSSGKVVQLVLDAAFEVKKCPTTGKPELPNYQSVGDALARKFGSTWKFHRGYDAFLIYGHVADGIWSVVPSSTTSQIIINELTKAGAPQPYADNYLRLIKMQIKRSIPWCGVSVEQRKQNLIPFNNGAIEYGGSTLQFKPHSPHHGFFWQVPYACDPYVTCDLVLQDLALLVEGDAKTLNVLRACLNKIVVGNPPNRIIELISESSAATIIQNLAIALVGQQHVYRNEFARMNYYKREIQQTWGKCLLVVEVNFDYDYHLCDFLDKIRQTSETKQQRVMPHSPITPRIILTSSKPLHRLNRSEKENARRITVVLPDRVDSRFQPIPIWIDEQGNPRGTWAPYIPGVMNWLLSMPQAQVQEVFK